MMKRLFGLVVLILGGAGCLGDAPRENPFDPLSDNFEKEGSVSVLVTRYYPPFQGLGAAAVHLAWMGLPEGALPVITTETDETGRFIAKGMPEGRYQVRVEKTGFAEVVDTVEVAAGKTAEAEMRLGGLPVVTAPAVTSTHISRWWPATDLYQLEVVAEVKDLDGLADVETAWLEIPALAYTDTLASTQTAGLFMKNIPVSRLNQTSLEELLGLDLKIRARDKAGFEHVSGALRLVRVIEAVPVAREPQGLTLINEPRPLMRWDAMSLPFAYTYRVDVVRIETNIQNTVEVQTAIPSTATSVQVQMSLPPGSYFWTLSVVDAFGNRSRSKEAGFQIQ